MNTEQYLIRKADLNDCEKIFDLYHQVSKTIGGLARTEFEISIEYVQNFTIKALKNGVQFVMIDQLKPPKIIAEIHCYKLEPQVFGHVLSELTIVVDNTYQGKGLGKKLFQKALHYITEKRSDIFRVELIARESNTKAIQMYEKIGFKIEGKFDNRIKKSDNTFEADIPMAWFNPNFQILNTFF